MTPTIQNLTQRKPVIEAAAKRFGASDIRIFGSVARGTARDGSDVDILVRMERGRSLLDLVGLEQELADELGVPVDLVTEASLHPMLRSTILAESMHWSCPDQVLIGKGLLDRTTVEVIDELGPLKFYTSLGLPKDKRTLSDHLPILSDVK